MTPLLTVQGLDIAYGSGQRVVDGVDFAIAPGERLALIGESGSGKSTLALALAGLLPADAVISGRMVWPALRTAPRNGRDIGFVFQDAGASFDPVMTVGRQVAEVAETQLGLSRKAALARAAQLFERVRLPDPPTLLHAYPHQLSGGQRQRVGIAAAIVAEPAVLIADEPTSALDTIVQAEIMKLLEDLVLTAGMSLLFITHDIALAARHCERIAVMRQGRIVESGTASQIVGRPSTDYTRQLLAACLTLDSPPAA
jgi:peptide/nickel transport system ATP-binding protein